jgi:TRAP-type C4-dicarboxylate transport system permease small subunit
MQSGTGDAPHASGLWSRVENAFAVLAQGALFVLLLLVLVQVFTRYALNDPIGEVVAVTETYLMPIIVFFTIAALQRNDGHIRVDLLHSRFAGRGRHLADLVITLVSAAFWAVVVHASIQETLFSWQMGYEISKNLPFPVASAIGVVPIGGSLILIRLLMQAVAALRALRAPQAPSGDLPA